MIEPRRSEGVSVSTRTSFITLLGARSSMGWRFGMKRSFSLLLLLLLSLTFDSPVHRSAAKSGEAEILRDEYGVPHVFANRLEDAAYAIGYAQAEDRLEELLKNYRKAEGTMSEAFGPEWYRHDYTQRMWRHAAISREKYNEVSPKMR